MENKTIKIVTFINIFFIIFLSPIIGRSNKLTAIYLFLQCLLSLYFIVNKKINKYEYLFFIVLLTLFIIHAVMNINDFMVVFITFEKYLLLYVSYINLKNSFKFIWGNTFIKFTANMGNILTVYCIIERLLKKNILYINIFSEKYSNVYGSLENNHFYQSLGVYRISGSMEHPIVIANALLIFSFLNIYIFFKTNEKKYLLFSLLNVVAIIFTESRSAYLAYGLGIGLLLLAYIKKILLDNKFNKVERNKKIRNLLIILVLAVILVNQININEKSVFEYIIDRFSQMFTYTDRGSLHQRLGSINFIYEYLLTENNIFKILFGNGFGTLANYLRINEIAFVNKGFYVVDNQYLTLIYDVGVLSFILVIGWILRKIYKYIKRVLEKDTLKMELIIPVVLNIALMVNIFFYDAFTWIPSVILISYSLALLSHSYEEELQEK